MVLNLFKKKSSALDQASLDVLRQAEEQRSRMDLVFEESGSSLKGLSASVNSFKNDRLILDVYGLNRSDRLIGKHFICYFRVREGRAGVGFYSFRTSVANVLQTTNGGLAFVAPMPDSVARAQRRKSMRVRIDHAWFEEFILWKGGRLVGPSPADRLLGLDLLRKAKPCRLENMSAGGIGLHFERDFCRQSEFYPSMQDEFSLFARFAEEVRNQPRELWLSGRAVRLVEDRVTRDLSLGIEFGHVGLGPLAGGEMRWQAVHDNVVEELLARIFGWHAAMARERAGLGE